jgi:predicted nucleic acid-binding protein
VSVRLLDTNIVSFLLKAHSLAARYKPHLTGHTLAVSFMTVAELLEWATHAGWGARRTAALASTISGLLVLHSDATICRIWADVRAGRRSQPIGVADAWVAATALANGIELVTHNPRDFAGIPGLRIVSEYP